VANILVVEDEPAIAESVAYALGKAGHTTAVAGSLREARIRLDPSIHLLVLDLMLPDGSGFDLIVELEERRQSGLAVIVLSSRDGEADRVRALESGADDYVTKPFSPREIVARVTAVTRRMKKPNETDVAGAGTSLATRLRVNLETRRAQVDEQTIELTRVEFDLLALLLSRPGFVFSRSTIIDEVWGEGFALSDRTIDSHVKALRKKIVEGGGESDWIGTVRGVGYRSQEETKS
jgi:DNA-binding response OmpR family regulator